MLVELVFGCSGACMWTAGKDVGIAWERTTSLALGIEVWLRIGQGCWLYRWSVDRSTDQCAAGYPTMCIYAQCTDIVTVVRHDLKSMRSMAMAITSISD